MAEYLWLGTNFLLVISIATFIMGIVIGSFLNVCIYRIPKKEDIAVERSHCMSCGHVLSWYELIPVISFTIQGGKCRSCKKKISWQYPIVELMNGLAWIAVLWTNGLEWKTILYCLCASILIVITVIDARTYEIPFGLNIAITVLGVIHLAIDYPHWYEYLIGFFIVSGFFYILYLVTKGRGIGGGDIKLMAAAGLLLGWKLILLAMVIGCVLGAIIHPIRMAVSKKDHVLAFGPYLSVGIFLSILFGKEIVLWYASLVMG